MLITGNHKTNGRATAILLQEEKEVSPIASKTSKVSSLISFFDRFQLDASKETTKVAIKNETASVIKSISPETLSTPSEVKSVELSYPAQDIVALNNSSKIYYEIRIT